MVLRLKAWKSRSPPGPASPPKTASPGTQTHSPDTHLTRGGAAGSPRQADNCRETPRGEPERSVERHPGRESDPGPGYTPNAGWSSPVARQAHNLKVTGSNPVPATTDS